MAFQPRRFRVKSTQLMVLLQRAGKTGVTTRDYATEGFEYAVLDDDRATEILIKPEEVEYLPVQ